MQRIIPSSFKPATAALLAALALGLTACGGHSSSNVSVDPEDIKYTYDSRTGKCFAYVGSGNLTKTTGVALAQVPCDDAVMAQIPEDQK